MNEFTDNKDDGNDIPTNIMNQVSFGNPSAPKQTQYQPRKPVSEQEAEKPAPKKPSLELMYGDWTKQRTPANMGKVITAAKPVIDSALRSFGSGADVKSKAKILAIEAVKSYQPNRNTKLSTHLYSRLQSLKRAALKQKNVVDVSERYYNEKNKIKGLRRDFSDLNDREPSDNELADLSGYSSKRIRFLDTVNNNTLSESGVIADAVAKDSDATLPGTNSQSKEDVWVSYVHHDASPTDQMILEWKTGYNGKDVLSNTEIAKRLKITPAAVSQRSAKISKRISEGM